MTTYHLGTQSWTSLPGWLGTFYPPDLRQADALPFYARVFGSVEVNATFHAIPSGSTVQGWYQKTPEDFVFALKTPRAITHEARLDLDECGPLVDQFLEVARLLEDKVGPILVQLPPSFDRSDRNRLLLATYLDRLPLQSRRFAVELRHPSWVDESVGAALRERNVAWVAADGGRNSREVMHTADFLYARLGRSGYEFPDFSRVRLDRDEDLDWWASTLKRLPESTETAYVYVCDEFAGHAPASVQALAARLGLSTVEPRSQWPQPSLF